MDLLNDRYKFINKNSINNIIVLFFVVSMLISDWLIGPIAVSEVVYSLIFILIIFIDIQLFHDLDYKYIILMMIYLIGHVFFQTLYNDDFIFKYGFYSLIKSFFYIIIIDLVYNYIKKSKSEKKLLRAMNIGAVFAIAIGLYITIAIALNKELPYEFIWEFTRTDTFSYQFQGNSNIIRTRSLFSEPAHLGYFLNIVLTINLFSKYKDDYKLFFETFIIFGILLTLSYSSIIIMISLIILRSIMYIYNNGFKKIKINKYGLLFILIIVVASAFIMQDFLYTTLIERTIGIFNGIDNSAYNRIYNSWSYISKESLVLGNGIGHTPPIQNIYAYFLSDLGILPFIIICAFTVYVLKLNLGFGFAFILLNFSKGGYLSPIFLVFLICLFIFTFDFESEQLK